ncbi:hypothetical protein Scep_000522 [Stephania cephalantha]|uniref:GH10 domain-containing protein n=1 Tax=Stephania cephalantha TaxID=152367 RepID=A0AAP0L6U6_9MAGN
MQPTQVRKRNIRLQATDIDGNALAGIKVSIKQTKMNFPFGCGMNKKILMSTDYQNWFKKRFSVTTFSNEMKWYSTEGKQGQENYTLADAMLSFAQENNISVRGHNIIWDNKKEQPQWVHQLDSNQLRAAATQRVSSIVTRYKGQVIGWDVVNENLHFSFYEDTLGENASAAFYSQTRQLDPKTILFMNEYNTIEDNRDQLATPDKYLKMLQRIKAFPGNNEIQLGIGLEAHFPPLKPNIAYMRAGLDMLGSAKYPIWLTEVDIGQIQNQAGYLEEILREGYSHPGVTGIVIFSGPYIKGCWANMCMTDPNFKNTAVGDAVDKLLKEWKFGAFEATTNSEGYIETSLFHGDYEVSVLCLERNSSYSLGLNVAGVFKEETIHVLIKL